MSAAITTGHDLLVSSRLPELPSLFTTFAAGHFVKPAASVQPAVVKSFSYTEIYVAAPIDLDYDEPNAVVEQELEFIIAGDPVHHLQVARTNKAVETREPVARVAA